MNQMTKKEMLDTVELIGNELKYCTILNSILATALATMDQRNPETIGKMVYSLAELANDRVNQTPEPNVDHLIDRLKAGNE